MHVPRRRALHALVALILQLLHICTLSSVVVVGQGITKPSEGDPCAKYTTCKACYNNILCGWCKTAKGRCVVMPILGCLGQPFASKPSHSPCPGEDIPDAPPPQITGPVVDKAQRCDASDVCEIVAGDTKVLVQFSPNIVEIENKAALDYREFQTHKIEVAPMTRIVKQPIMFDRGTGYQIRVIIKNVKMESFYDDVLRNDDDNARISKRSLPVLQKYCRDPIPTQYKTQQKGDRVGAARINIVDCISDLNVNRLKKLNCPISEGFTILSHDKSCVCTAENRPAAFEKKLMTTTWRALCHVSDTPKFQCNHILAKQKDCLNHPEKYGYRKCDLSENPGCKICTKEEEATRVCLDEWTACGNPDCKYARAVLLEYSAEFDTKQPICHLQYVPPPYFYDISYSLVKDDVVLSTRTHRFDGPLDDELLKDQVLAAIETKLDDDDQSKRKNVFHHAADSFLDQFLHVKHDSGVPVDKDLILRRRCQDYDVRNPAYKSSKDFKTDCRQPQRGSIEKTLAVAKMESSLKSQRFIAVNTKTFQRYITHGYRGGKCMTRPPVSNSHDAEVDYRHFQPKQIASRGRSIRYRLDRCANDMTGGAAKTCKPKNVDFELQIRNQDNLFLAMYNPTKMRYSTMSAQITPAGEECKRVLIQFTARTWLSSCNGTLGIALRQDTSIIASFDMAIVCPDEISLSFEIDPPPSVFAILEQRRSAANATSAYINQTRDNAAQGILCGDLMDALPEYAFEIRDSQTPIVIKPQKNDRRVTVEFDIKVDLPETHSQLLRRMRPYLIVLGVICTLNLFTIMNGWYGRDRHRRDRPKHCIHALCWMVNDACACKCCMKDKTKFEQFQKKRERAPSNYDLYDPSKTRRERFTFDCAQHGCIIWTVLIARLTQAIFFSLTFFHLVWIMMNGEHIATLAEAPVWFNTTAYEKVAVMEDINRFRHAEVERQNREMARISQSCNRAIDDEYQRVEREKNAIVEHHQTIAKNCDMKSMNEAWAAWQNNAVMSTFRNYCARVAEYQTGIDKVWDVVRAANSIARGYKKICHWGWCPDLSFTMNEETPRIDGPCPKPKPPPPQVEPVTLKLVKPSKDSLPVGTLSFFSDPFGRRTDPGKVQAPDFELDFFDWLAEVFGSFRDVMLLLDTIWMLRKLVLIARTMKQLILGYDYIYESTGHVIQKSVSTDIGGRPVTVRKVIASYPAHYPDQFGGLHGKCERCLTRARFFVEKSKFPVGSFYTSVGLSFICGICSALIPFFTHLLSMDTIEQMNILGLMVAPVSVTLIAADEICLRNALQLNQQQLSDTNQLANRRIAALYQSVDIFNFGQANFVAGFNMKYRAFQKMSTLMRKPQLIKEAGCEEITQNDLVLKIDPTTTCDLTPISPNLYHNYSEMEFYRSLYLNVARFMAAFRSIVVNSVELLRGILVAFICIKMFTEVIHAMFRAWDAIACNWGLYFRIFTEPDVGEAVILDDDGVGHRYEIRPDDDDDDAIFDDNAADAAWSEEEDDREESSMGQQLWLGPQPSYNLTGSYRSSHSGSIDGGSSQSSSAAPSRQPSLLKKSPGGDQSLLKVINF